MRRKEEYHPEKLFRIGCDEIIYKYENPSSKIIYNTMDYAGMLDTSKEPCVIKFPSLSEIEWVQHGFSTRLGGASTNEFSTMNLSYSRGDQQDHVSANYKRICRSIGIHEEDIVYTDQVHGTKIHAALKRNRGLDSECRVFGIDGLVTNTPNLPLAAFYADCVPLYFVDLKRKAIGLSHSGWKGTVGKIGKKTVESMVAQFHTDPKDLTVVIGPSICCDCYEVGEEAAREFQKVFSKTQLINILEDKKNGKYQLDLWLANKYILLEAGVPEEQIAISNICTCCNSTLLYSHRASGGKRGNLAAFLSIKEGRGFAG